MEILARQAELAEIERLLGDVGEGPAALILEGEAGIGKTIVWQAGLDAARERGFRVLASRPAGSEVQLSFAALGDLLGGVVMSVLPQLPAPQRRALESALLLADPDGAPPDPRTLGVAFVSALQAAAEEGPLLIAIDDAQWLDDPSATTLEFAWARLEAAPVGLLATARTGDGHATRRLDLARAPSHRRLQVGPLSLGALHELLRTRLGHSFPRPTLVRVHETSRGNPLYALEIARELERRGTDPAPGEPLPIPDDVHALLRGRLSRLSAGTRELVVAAAATPRPTVQLLEAIADPTELDHAIEAGVLVTEGDAVRFSHPLLASAAYSDAPPGRRREVHRRLGAAVGDAEERARHLALAAGRTSERVAGSLESAARNAAQRGSPGTAAELAELSLRLTPSTRPADGQRRKLLLGELSYTVGQAERAAKLFKELVAELPAGAERARALLNCAMTNRDVDPAPLDEALREAQHAPLVRGKALVLRATLMQILGRLPEALDDAQSAVAVAEEVDEPTLLAESLAAAAFFGRLAGRPVDFDLIERAIELEDELSTPLPFYSPSLAAACLLMWAGRIEEARARFEAAERWALERGDEVERDGVLFHRVELECQAGELEEAAKYVELARQLSDQMGTSMDQPRSANLYAEALISAYRGHSEDARALAGEAIALSHSTLDRVFWLQAQSVLGFLELSLGNAAEADRQLRPLIHELAMYGYGDPSVFRVLPNAIEALIALGDLEVAREVLEQLEDQGRVLDSPWALSQAARCRALLAAEENRFDDALELFQQALEEHERLPVPFERARTLLALGSVQRRAQQKRAARETLEQALAIFEELGTPLWADKARAELGRIGGRRVPSAGALTATEAAIAELVATGRTNEEVAEALSLSPRTVQWNLSKVYRKLGVRSRTELAATVSSSPDKR